MLTIRLQRVGRRHTPDFRIVLAEKHRAASKKAVEVFGQYNPKTKIFNLSDEQGLKNWIEKKVEVSPTVWNLLVSKNIISGAKHQAWKPRRKEKEEAAPVEPKASTGDSKKEKTEQKQEEESKKEEKAEATKE